jgi:nucleotide-binding universal stress UspA family protein
MQFEGWVRKKEQTMDIKNVLVPTDFSLPAKAALNYGVAVARKFRARLTLVHVLDVQPLLTAAAELDSNLELERREEALDKLSALLVPEDEDDLDLHVVVKSGDLQSEIIRTIAEQSADIVVLGTHGRGRLGRFIIGSTTEQLLRKLAIPVLTVRSTRPLDFRRILFATDLSEPSMKAFDFALSLAQGLRSDIVAVHAVDKAMTSSAEDVVATEMRDVAMRQARQKLDMLVTEGKRHGVEIQTVLAEGTAAREILKTSDQSGADLILLAISSKGFLERALIGATAEQVVREANVPVLSIPSSGGALDQTAGSKRPNARSA